MLVSFFIFIISVCFMFIAKRLAIKWVFLTLMAEISIYLLVACAVLFVTMGVVTIVKAIKK